MRSPELNGVLRRSTVIPVCIYTYSWLRVPRVNRENQNECRLRARSRFRVGTYQRIFSPSCPYRIPLQRGLSHTTSWGNRIQQKRTILTCKNTCKIRPWLVILSVYVYWHIYLIQIASRMAITGDKHVRLYNRGGRHVVRVAGVTSDMIEGTEVVQTRTSRE